MGGMSVYPARPRQIGGTHRRGSLIWESQAPNAKETHSPAGLTPFYQHDTRLTPPPLAPLPLALSPLPPVGAKRCYTWGLVGVPRKSTYKWEIREKKAGNNPISLHLKTYI